MIETQVDQDISELFSARFSAYKELGSSDLQKKNNARQFLLDTMTQSEEEYHFPLKEKFVESVSDWGVPVILAKKSDGDLNALVYKINYLVDRAERVLHEISFFKKNDEGKFKYTHKFDLANLYEQFCLNQQPLNDIRLIGDAVLHKEAKNVEDFSDRELLRQIELLKTAVTDTGGVGIAANQCAKIEAPLKVILVGVDYANPEHVVKAVTRYPNTLFPQLKIFLNPVVVDMSEESEVFSEGCLSVQGIFRGSVRRPKKVTVRYQDLGGTVHEETFSGGDARVILHELDHILNGKVYMQRIIEELTEEQCRKLLEISKKILSALGASQGINPFFTPINVFKRDSVGNIEFDTSEVEYCFRNTKSNVLVGLNDVLQEKLNNKLTFAPK